MESTNKVLESILIKVVACHQRDWIERLLEVLCGYKTTWRNTTRFCPYEPIFHKNPIFPIEFEIKTLRTALEVDLDLTTDERHQLEQLNELDEKRFATV